MSANTTQEVVQDFDLDTIITSRTNPRTVFDEADLQEMAGTIKAQGRVQQPILLRPLPASRIEETAHMKPRPTHEIVFGERRYRSSKLANMRTIKGTSREITDDEVLLIQLIENMERRDLSPLEEGAGFRRLMDETGKTAEEVGKSVNRSRAYVYGRAKLLDLATDTRDALRAGKIEASTALLVARVPNSALQAKFLKQILQGSYSYEEGKNRPLSHRAAQELLQREYMVQLNKAVFDIKSAVLLPAAGDCKSCPKRTGANPDLYEEVKSADVCTDPTCFHKKEEAHAAAKVAEAEAKGLTVIAGKEAQELRAAGYQEKLKGYRRLDNAEDSPTDQPLRKIIGAQMKADGIKPVMIEDPRNKGKFLECLPNETVLKLLKVVENQAAAAKANAGDDAPKVSEGVQKLVDEKKAKQEAKAKEQFEREWRQELVASSWQDLAHDATTTGMVPRFTKDVHRYLAVRAASSLSTANAEAIAKLLNLGKVAAGSAVVDFAKETPHPELLQLLIIAQEASGPHEHSYNGRIANEGMLLVAGVVFGSRVDEVITEIKAEVKAKIWPKAAKKAPAPSAPLAQPKNAGGDKPKGAKGSGKKAAAAPAKLSAEEAKAGIAAAMQGVERPASAPGGAVTPTEATKGETQGLLAGLGFALGQVVQVTSDSSKFGARLAMHKWCGKKGTITGRAGTAWDVTFKGRSGGVAAFDEDEISLAEGAAA